MIFSPMPLEGLYLIVPEPVYEPGSASGIAWNDPQLAIAWPLPVSVMSQRDAQLPPLQAARAGHAFS